MSLLHPNLSKCELESTVAIMPVMHLSSNCPAIPLPSFSIASLQIYNAKMLEVCMFWAIVVAQHGSSVEDNLHHMWMH